MATIDTTAAQAIAKTVAERAEKIEYEITVPDSLRPILNAGASRLWETLVDMECEYVDGYSDPEDTETLLGEAAAEEGTDAQAILEDLFDVNQDHEFEVDRVPFEHGGMVSVRSAIQGLARVILDDLGGAWSDAVRQAVIDHFGQDADPGSMDSPLVFA